MKKALLFLLFLLCTITSITAQSSKKNQKAVIQTTLFCDHCKQCETCGKNFQTNLLDIKGVKMYDLDEKAMTITVYFNSQKTNLQDIKIAISKMGYDADEIKADASAYAQLDECCKKV